MKTQTVPQIPTGTSAVTGKSLSSGAPGAPLPTCQPNLTIAEALREAYGSLCGVQELMADELQSIQQRDPLERFIIDQDAADLLVSELAHTRRMLEHVMRIAHEERLKAIRHERIMQSGLILPASRLGN